MKLRAVIDEGQIVPWYLGLAYRRFDLRDRVCYIVPLNWAVRWLRNL